MDELYVKPGNQERGWNDPPQFSYGLQMARGPQRNLLNKRASPAASPGAGAPPMNPLAPPPSRDPLTTLHPHPPPPACVATPPAPPPGAVSETEVEPDVEAVVLVLNQALAACRQTVKEQVCNEVAKRLRLLEDSWRAGRLSLPVRRRMDTLSLELQAARWDAADEIHRSLMVDHVTEVSQWMVGVKRLIAETRTLGPEFLEAFQKPAGPDQNPVDPDQNRVDPDQNPVDPDQNPVDPDQNPVDPDQKTVSQP